MVPLFVLPSSGIYKLQSVKSLLLINKLREKARVNQRLAASLECDEALTSKIQGGSASAEMGSLLLHNKEGAPEQRWRASFSTVRRGYQSRDGEPPSPQ